MVNGNGVIVEFGIENDFGEYAAPKDRIAVSSESLGYSRNATEEGLLLGGVGKGLTETMSLHTEGDIATLAKPKSVGYVLAGLMGVEQVADSADENSKFKHLFTPIGNHESDSLPSFSFTIDRGINVQSYTGVKFNSCSFTAAAEDRLQLSLSVNGKDEVQNGTINNALKPETNRAFKFHSASVKMDGEKVADITSIQFDYNNNLDTSLFTTNTGLYCKEPEAGTREATCQFEALYTTETEAIRNGKFKTDAIVSIEIEFTDTDKNKLVFRIPYGQITEMATPTAGGAETLKTSLTVSAVDNLTDNYVEVELYNDYPDGYLADATVIEATGSGD